MKIKTKVERSVKSNRQAPKFSCCEWLLIMLTWTVVIVFFPLSLLLTIKLAPQYERAVVFRLGKLRKDAGSSGLFCVLPCADEFRRIDMRTRMFDVPPQEVLTRDSVTVKVEAVIYYRVTDACMAVGNIERCDVTTRLLAQTSLRNIMGTRTLTDILTDRDDVSRDVIAILDDVTDVWGVKVERVEVKDVRLPTRLQRAMAAEAEASREAKAKVIAAEGEMNSSRKLKEAADAMGASPNALQLRYLQTLAAISAENNSTIVLPLPETVIEKLSK